MHARLNTCFFKDSRLKVLFSVCFMFFAGFLLLHNCGGGTRGRRKFRVTKGLVFPVKDRDFRPEMVFIDGGSFAIGGTDGSESRIITVEAFYLSVCLISNRLYLIYLNDLLSSGDVAAYRAALPNLSVLRSEFVFNDDLVKYYLAARVFFRLSSYCSYSSAS